MSLLFRDLNILSAPNNSTNFSSVTVQRDPGHGDERRPRGQKHHGHHQKHSHKSSKHHCR